MEPGVLGLVTEATESFTSAVDHLCAGGPGKGFCYLNSWDGELEAPLLGDA